MPDEVIGSDNHHNQNYEDFDFGSEIGEVNLANRIKAIYEMPGAVKGIEDCAPWLIRGVYKNRDEQIAAVKLAKRFRKYHDQEHMAMLRDRVTVTSAENGRSRLEALFAGTNLLAPGMYSQVTGTKHTKDEQVYRGSDFRQQQKQDRDQGVM